jgi:hypothetical protein
VRTATASLLRRYTGASFNNRAPGKLICEFDNHTLNVNNGGYVPVINSDSWIRTWINHHSDAVERLSKAGDLSVFC